ncbi:MAG TPA: tocopherol cyclase family protein, partial [Actinomycetota bacterium]|nr:tocopherol cyclase family protein [Actinomycetota bacterium]
RWDLDFGIGDPTYRILPDALYRSSLAPTKPFVPNPDARFSGTLEVDGETVRLEGAPGQQGHLHGERHAERWAWVHASGFEGADGVVLEGLSAQGRRGPLRTPHTTFVGLRWGGEWLRFGRASRRRGWDLGRWRIDLASRSHHLFGTVTAGAGTLVRARYEDPDGTERFCHNSTVASVHLTLLEKTTGGYEELANLVADGTAQAEWAGRTPAPAATAVHQPIDEPEPATPVGGGSDRRRRSGRSRPRARYPPEPPGGDATHR